MNRLLLLLGCWAGALSAAGQTPFEETAFLQAVLAQHPVARQADLLNDAATAYLRKARGAFDPKLFASDKSKSYSGTDYYAYRGAGVVAETHFGIALESSWNETDGAYLNPESTLPEGGLWSVGATVRLGQGLLTDARRTALRKAEAYVTLNAAQRTAALNDLLLDAAAAYWKWYKAHEAAEVAQEAERLALIRLEGIRAAVTGGDRAAIDTVEARLRWSTRRMEAAAAATVLAQSRAKAAAWLWDDAGRPVALAEGVTPVAPTDWVEATIWVTLKPLNDRARSARWQSHPLNDALAAKGAAADAEIRLAREQLKPQLDARFLALSATSPTALGTSDYALELKAALPLFLRKERGALELARIDRENIALDLENKARKWEAEAYGAGLAWADHVRAWEAALETEALAEALLDAENIKFAAGESSVFLLNSREASLVKARKARIEAEVEAAMAWRRLGWIWGEPQP